MKMPFHLKQLTGWFIIIFLLRGPVQEILLAKNRLEELSSFLSSFISPFMWSSALSFFGFALVPYAILYFIYGRRPNWQVVLTILVGVFLCILFRAFLEEVVLYNIIGRHNYNPLMSWRNYIIDHFYFIIVYTALGVVYFFVQFSTFNQKRAQAAELIRRQTELKFLRSQVNPHFLFNVLNNVYALVETGPDKALAAIEQLSGLLRYSLYEQNQLVPLSREIDYLHDFINLENIRLPQQTQPLQLGQFTQEWELPPMLLVPFVENAFKHGNLRQNPADLVVSIWESDKRTLDFKVATPLTHSKASVNQQGGIGIQNVRQRLALLYPDRHHLSIDKTEGQHTVHLQLKK